MDDLKRRTTIGFPKRSSLFSVHPPFPTEPPHTSSPWAVYRQEGEAEEADPLPRPRRGEMVVGTVDDTGAEFNSKSDDDMV